MLKVDLDKLLFEIKAVRFNAKKPFRYTSGMLSPIYCDMRLVISYPRVRDKVVDEYLTVFKKKLNKTKIDVISGTATGAVPIASWIAFRLGLPMVYVRNNHKDHGLYNKVEGVFKKGSRIVVIEDIVSSGKSALNNIASIRHFGGKVNACVAMASYELTETKEKLKKAKVKLYNLLSMPVLVDKAVEQGVLKENEREIVLDWLADPWGWGARQGFRNET